MIKVTLRMMIVKTARMMNRGYSTCIAMTRTLDETVSKYQHQVLTLKCRKYLMIPVMQVLQLLQGEIGSDTAY